MGAEGTWCDVTAGGDGGQERSPDCSARDSRARPSPASIRLASCSWNRPQSPSSKPARPSRGGAGLSSWRAGRSAGAPRAPAGAGRAPPGAGPGPRPPRAAARRALGRRRPPRRRRPRRPAGPGPGAGRAEASRPPRACWPVGAVGGGGKGRTSRSIRPATTSSHILSSSSPHPPQPRRAVPPRGEPGDRSHRRPMSVAGPAWQSRVLSADTCGFPVNSSPLGG